jgi:hypothetical protein
MHHLETIVQVENSECVHYGHNLVDNKLGVSGTGTASMNNVGHLNKFPVDVLRLLSELLQHLDATLRVDKEF